MAELLKAVNTVQERKKKEFILQLKKLEIYEIDGVPVEELDYYQLRHALTLARIQNEQ